MSTTKHTPGRFATHDAALIETAPELLEALRSVEREHELVRLIQDCASRRHRKGFGWGDGRAGILVHKDEDALEAQGYDRELQELRKRRLAAIARATGEGA